MKLSGTRLVATAFLVVVATLSTITPIRVGEAAAQVNTFTVNSTGDQKDADLTDSRCATSVGTCTLRAAVEQANAKKGPDRIEFAIAGAGVKTIRLGSKLAVDDSSGALTIDGYSQSGAKANTAAEGSNARLLIEISGPTTDAAFEVRSSANTFRGLALYGALREFYLVGANADGNKIVGNFIGTNSAGTFTQPVYPKGSAIDYTGLFLHIGASQNVIGTPDPADRNVISGNGRFGIRVNHGETNQNFIQNNVIGLNPSLTAALNQLVGIDLQWWTWGNLVGGDKPNEGNLISGNSQYGLEFSHAATANLGIGNRIGTMADGNSVSSFSGGKIGVVYKDAPSGNYVAKNVVGGFEYGVRSLYNYTPYNAIVDNRIGVGLRGGDIRNGNEIILSGYDFVLQNNLIGDNHKAILVDDHLDGKNHFWKPSYTHGNQIRQGQYRTSLAPDRTPRPSLNSEPVVDIIPAGPVNLNDQGDADKGVQDLLNWPVITGVGPGKVFGTACANCEVEVYTSGSITGTGEINVTGTSPGSGLAWIGTARTDVGGRWSLAHPSLVAGRTVSALAVDSLHNTSELPSGQRIPLSHSGTNGSAQPSIGPAAKVVPPAMPTRYAGAKNASIVGSVIDRDNRGYAGVGIDLFNEDRSQWLWSTQTVGSGKFTFPVQPGCYTLTFVAPKAGNFTTGKWHNRKVCVEAGQTSTLDAVLQIGGARTVPKIQLKVADRDGVPAAKVHTDLFTSNANGDRLNYLRSLDTDSDGGGRYELSEPGCRVVTFQAGPDQKFVESGSRWLNRSICLKAGENVVLTATINSSSAGNLSELSGKIVANGEPGLEVTVDLFQASADGSRGRWLAFDTVGDDSRFSHSVEPGCYVLTYVAPKTYRWKANNQRWWNRSVCVAKGQSMPNLDGDYFLP